MNINNLIDKMTREWEAKHGAKVEDLLEESKEIETVIVGEMQEEFVNALS